MLLLGSPGGDDAPALSQPVNCELRLQGEEGEGGGVSVGEELEALTASEK